MKTKLQTSAEVKFENNFLKKLCYLLMLFSGLAFGQIVNIPDSNFRAALLSANSTNNIASTEDSNNPSTYTSIDTNGDGQIQVSEATVIKFLNISGSNSSVVANLVSLSGIESFVNLRFFYCDSHSITSLDVSSMIELKELNCEFNQLTSLNVSGLTNLLFIHCGGNQLTSLNASGLASLQWLFCSVNQLTSLNVSNSNNINYLRCDNNQLTNINISGLVNLQNLHCEKNQLTTLDLSSQTGLSYLDCNSNQLTSLFIKNGIDESDPQTFIVNNPNLQYICADDSQIADIESAININGYTNCQVNSYCSFTPGGNYNTITGSIKFDANNNGCDASDLPQPNIRININDGTNTGATFTNNTGNYTFYTQAGSFDLISDTENPTWFTFSPVAATIPFLDNNNNTTIQDFCIAANGVHNDLEVVVEPILLARPGFDTIYKIAYKNKGNQMLSGEVSFTYDDSVLDFVSATIVPNSQNTGALNWNYSNLLPFENRSFYITLHVNAPTDMPSVNIGDSLTFTATITPIIADEHPLDNAFTLNQTVVGSFDPNNIACLEGAVVPPSQIGSYLHYGVNFENTGTSQAQNIVVKVVIDTTKYDVSSLQMLNTSNPAYIKITGNVVEFIFQNIMLDTGGHGDVLFKIKTLNSLNTGDMVTKTADIFFDYNAPINTGMANTTFQSLNNDQFIIDNSIVVLPNPTVSNVIIKGNSNIKSVQVYDAQGRLLENKLLDNVKTTIYLSDKTNGIYFLKITSVTGGKVEKIIKE